MTEAVRFIVNGRSISTSVPANRILADYLRDDLLLRGCRIACDAAMCGACTVLVDGNPTAACATFVFDVAERTVETIESLAADGVLHPIQQAFLEADAFQCGFWTAGMIMSVKALLARDPDPDEASIRLWLDANLCRCTGYRAIIDAVTIAARAMRDTR